MGSSDCYLGPRECNGAECAHLRKSILARRARRLKGVQWCLAGSFCIVGVTLSLLEGPAYYIRQDPRRIHPPLLKASESSTLHMIRIMAQILLPAIRVAIIYILV